jgi:hypothetical protein
MFILQMDVAVPEGWRSAIASYPAVAVFPLLMATGRRTLEWSIGEVAVAPFHRAVPRCERHRILTDASAAHTRSADPIADVRDDVPLAHLSS